MSEITTTKKIWILIKNWYGGAAFVTDDGKKHISYSHPPRLMDLFRAENVAYDFDENDIKTVHEQLLQDEYLQEGYLLRTPVNWLPTEKGINHYMSNVELVGLKNGLTHHTGVEITARKYSFLDIQKYPSPFDRESPDVIVELSEVPDWWIEVWTGFGDTDNSRYEQLLELHNKLRVFETKQSTVMVVFSDRNKMCNVLNYLDENDSGFSLPGGQLSKPYNKWSSRRINEKLWKAKNLDQYQNKRIDFAQTITGVWDADGERIKHWAQSYYNNTDHY